MRMREETGQGKERKRKREEVEASRGKEQKREWSNNIEARRKRKIEKERNRKGREKDQRGRRKGREGDRVVGGVPISRAAVIAFNKHRGRFWQMSSSNSNSMRLRERKIGAGRSGTTMGTQVAPKTIPDRKYLETAQ